MGLRGDSESIAWSPVISLTGATDAEVTFDHTAKYQTTLRSLCKFVVRVEGETDYTELPIPVWPEPDSWKFVSSGKISLSDFDGKQIRFGSRSVEHRRRRHLGSQERQGDGQQINR